MRLYFVSIKVGNNKKSRPQYLQYRFMTTEIIRH